MGGQVLVNTQMPNLVGYFLSADEQPVPMGPQFEYSGPDPDMATCIQLGRQLMEERPIWTRRSLLNALGSKIKNAHIVKRCAGYVGYQFRGGPFRDAVIKYGVDPRTDPKYRKYQTLIFNMRKLQPGYAGETWHSLRSIRTEQRQPMGDNFQSHIFDGKAFWTDSKIWQICDITDPLIVRIVEESPVRPECGHMSSGWFHGPTWAKLKAVMKTKMMAIQFGRKISDDEYSGIIQIRDTTPPPGAPATRLPVPDLKLTEEEMRTIYGKNWKMPKNRRKAFEYRVPGRKGKELEMEARPEMYVPAGFSFQPDGFSFQQDLMEGGESGEDDEGGEDLDGMDEALDDGLRGHRGGQPTSLMAAAGFGEGNDSQLGLAVPADEYDEDEDGYDEEGEYDEEEYDEDEAGQEDEGDDGQDNAVGSGSRFMGQGPTPNLDWNLPTGHGWTGQGRS
jgi:general transcription factor 3C polypeptide 5 (transcription factor C subunit 1)